MPNPLRVAFTDCVFEDRDLIRLDGCEFRLFPPLRTAEEIVAAAAEADVLCMRDQFGRITPEVLRRLPNLRLIVTRSTGYDHIDVAAAARQGVGVCHVPDYGAHMIAEMAFGLLLAVARNIVSGNERYRRERRFSDAGLQGIELRGKTLGVVGAGRIGRQVIGLARAFGMRVLAHDVAPDPAASRALGFEYAPLEQVLAESDLVSLHVRLTPGTRHLIDAAALARMKRGAILVNTSRGAVVDTAALIEALRCGHLAGAGLDVLEDEHGAYHDFAGLNVVVTPHLGWYTDGAVARILGLALDAIAAFQRGEIINRVG
jgi:D-lactate dehydrogenase